jgi:hypothetical protein
MTSGLTRWLERIRRGRVSGRASPPRRRAVAVSLRRWANVLALAVLGLIFAMAIEVGLGTPVRRLAELWSGAPIPAIAIIMLAGLALACVPLAGIGGLHWRQVRRVLVYPPVWLSVVLALGAMFLLQRSGWPLPGFSVETWLWSMAICLGAPVMCVVAGKLLRVSMPTHHESTRRAEAVSADRTAQALSTDVAGSLIPWLEQEQPVEKPAEDDLFDLRYVAQRIAESFFDPKLATVGLVGPFGVGKSSIIAFVRYYIDFDKEFRARMEARWSEHVRLGHVAGFRAPHILLCPVSAWGLRDQPGAGVILRQAVTRLAAEVDCLSVSNLPEQYTQALKGVSPEWLNLPMLLSAPDDAEEQLRRLEPILEAINARLIVVVEDLDRNVESPALTHASRDRESARLAVPAPGRIARELEALFSRLVDLERVSFVLVVAHAGAADIARLCERIEPVHRIERGLALRMAGAFRAHCLVWARELGDAQPAHESTLHFMGGLDEWAALDLDMLGGRTPVTALAELVRTPRALKQALRHAWHAWKDLHGEVDFDDLLVCHVIRAVSPDAFDFLLEQYGVLSAGRGDGQQKDDMTAAWQAQIRDCNQDATERLWILTGFLFPGFAAASRSPGPPQGVQRRVYWDRVVRGRVAEAVRDQDILHAVAAWKCDASGSGLAGWLAADKAFAEAFERVIEGFPKPEFTLAHEEYRRLTSQVVEIGMRALGADACDDSIPGFIPLWRRARAVQENNGTAEWLSDEICKALPQSLAMGNDLKYYWADDKRSSLSQEQREEIRDRTAAWARKHITAEMLAKNLGRTDSAALYQFVTQRHVDHASAFDPTTWRWLVGPIIGAMGMAPAIVTPQVCLLLSHSQSQRKLDASRQWHHVTDYGLDEEPLNELAPEETERKSIVAALAGAPDPENDSPMRDIVIGVRDDARRLLESIKAGSIDASVKSKSLNQPPGADGKAVAGSEKLEGQERGSDR